MKVKILKEGVTLEKAVLDVGVTMDMSKEEADRLIKYGLVEVVNEPEEEPLEFPADEPEEEPLEFPADEPEEQPEPKKSTRGKKSE